MAPGRELQRIGTRFAEIVALTLLSLPGVSAPASAGVQTAIEYHLMSVWDYGDAAYFVTSLPVEIAALEVSVNSGTIQLTGDAFAVWNEPTDGALPVCRFFSARFVSHFYSPYQAECDKLRADPNWQYEGIVFHLRLPDQDGHCPSGTTVLYRLYNNGVYGTIRHRLTTRASIRDALLGEGWVFEGDSRTRAFACVP